MEAIGQTPNLIGAGIENRIPEDTDKMTRARLKEVGNEFEGVFLSMMLKEMRNTLENGGFFAGESSDTYGGMFDMFVGQDLAKSTPLGIAEILLQNYDKNKVG